MTNVLPNGDMLAPGHAYLEATQTGIKWEPDRVGMWDGGREVFAAASAGRSAYEYFYNLRFTRSFPQVTHWWFRSAWTQRVRLTGPQGTMDADTVWGYMQFVDESVPAQMWTATMIDGTQSEIFAPYPPNETQPVNIPLRLALARLVAGVIADEVARDEWMVVTSLVQSRDLEKVFPTTRAADGWRLEGLAATLREEFCHIQGLK